MRVVYMGTPAFAAQVLASMIEMLKAVEPQKAVEPDNIEIVAVYAQPDRQAGRGKKLHEPETKTLANSRGIPVFQPQTFRNNPDAVNELKALKPDVLVVAAYGMILPQEVLDIPTHGAYNIHTSLLPKYRGAAPVQRALMAGDFLSGVTIIRMEAGLDTGPILLQQAISIKDSEAFSDDSGTLLEALAESGAKLMKTSLNMIRENRVDLVPQNDERASHAPKLTKQEAQIDWNKSAVEIHNHVRGFFPNPGATAQLQLNEKDPIQVRIEKGFVAENAGFDEAEFFAQTPSHIPSQTASQSNGQAQDKNSNNTDQNSNTFNNTNTPTGTIIGIYKNYILVKTGKGYYGISQIRLAGKDPMDAKAFNNGYFKNNPQAHFLPKED